MSKRSEHQDKIALLNEAVTVIQKNGILDQLMKKYYGPGWKSINQ